MATSGHFDARDRSPAEALDGVLPAPLGARRRQLVYWGSVLGQSLLPGMGGSVVVQGHPGSGTNWLCWMLASYLGIPLLATRERLLPTLTPRVFHLHRFVGTPAVRRRTIYLHRDGRDALLSVYFKLKHDPKQAGLARTFRLETGQEIDPDRQREQFAGFLEWYISAPRASSMHWPRHIRRALGLRLHLLSFEALKSDPLAALRPVAQRLTGQFNQARIAAAIEANDLEHARTPDTAWLVRRGAPGQWREVYDRRAREIFAAWAGPELIALGYERDDGWVRRVA